MAPPADDTRNRLIDAAGQIFADKGFKSANIREICQQARANVAAINYHFGDKEQLYLEAVRQAYRTCAAQTPLPEWDEGVPPEARLRDFIRTLLTRVIVDREPAWHMQLWMRELAQPTAACAEWVREYVQPMAAMLRGILHQVLPQSTPETDSFMTAMSIVAQCLHYRLNRHVIIQMIGEEQYAGFTVERLTDHITRFSLAALGLNPPLVQEEAHA